jgi:hypothetical protein
MNTANDALQVPSWDRLAKWQGESIEFLRSGFDAFTKMNSAWLEFAQEPPKTKPGISTEVWSEAFTSYYKNLSDAFSGSLKMLGYDMTEGHLPWEDLFNSWKRFVAASPSDAPVPRRGLDDFIAYAKSWQKNYMRLFDAWIECLERTTAAYESGGDREDQVQKAMEACRASSEGFMAVWRQLADEQTNEFFQFLKSFQEKKKEAAKEDAGKTPRGRKKKLG